jgi:hypothetical protein
MVANRSDDPVRDVRLEPITDLPGLEVMHLTWISEHGQQQCTSAYSDPIPGPAGNTRYLRDGWFPATPGPSLDLTSCAPIAAELDPGQSLAVWADLQATVPKRQQAVYAVLGWENRGAVRSEVVVPLGSIAIEGWLSRVVSTLGSLSLPIVITVLGFAWAWWDKRREKRRGEAEELRGEIGQTWNIMLPISHRYASQCYMPLGAALHYALDAIRKYVQLAQGPSGTVTGAGHAPLEAEGSELTAKERDVFYWLMLFLSRQQYLARHVGGLYFKNRLGEQLAAYCYSEFYLLYTRDEEGLKKSLAAILRHVGRFETLDLFLAKLDGQAGNEAEAAPFQEGFRHLNSWLRGSNLAPGRAYLQALEAVLEYEINRPYERWYGHPQDLTIGPEVEQTLLSLSDRMGVGSAVEDYIAEGKKPTNRA